MNPAPACAEAPPAAREGARLFRAAGWLFSIQALLVGLWWLSLLLFPATRPWYFPASLLPLWGWMAANDLLCYGLLGGWGGVGLLLGERRHAPWLLVLASSGIWVVSIGLAVGCLRERGAWLGLAAMAGSALASAGATALMHLRHHPRLFLTAAPAPSLNCMLGRSLRQTLLLWATCLVWWPLLIQRMELAMDLPSFPAQRIAGGLLFTGCGLLGLASTVEMSRRGAGTPLPGACAPQLVTTGPYAFVRNPMAVAGIGQGLAAGLWLGSPMTLLYAAIGLVCWQVGACPAETRWLSAQFGEPYAAYRRGVRLWWPRLTPWRA